jgi:VanZ family protein
MKIIIAYWFPVILYGAVIFIQSSFSAPNITPSFPLADKMIHVLVFAGMGALWVRAFAYHLPPHAKGKRALLLGIIFAACYGALDEWHQSFVAVRDADLWDVLADTLGSIGGGYLYWFFGLYFLPMASNNWPTKPFKKYFFPKRPI